MKKNSNHSEYKIETFSDNEDQNQDFKSLPSDRDFNKDAKSDASGGDSRFNSDSKYFGKEEEGQLKCEITTKSQPP
jgi:hypothetical protein